MLALGVSGRGASDSGGTEHLLGHNPKGGILVVSAVSRYFIRFYGIYYFVSTVFG